MVCTAVYDINFYLWCCSSKLFSMEMKNFGKTWGKYLLEIETQNFFSYNKFLEHHSKQVDKLQKFSRLLATSADILAATLIAFSDPGLSHTIYH